MTLRHLPAPADITPITAARLSPPPARPAAALELLWNERVTETTGPVHRITIPVLARDVPPSLAADLTHVLSGWWVGQRSLTPSAAVTSVVASVQADPLAGTTLQLVLSTDGSIDGDALAGMRMIRDLRRAVRNLHLTRFAARSPQPAVVPAAA